MYNRLRIRFIVLSLTILSTILVLLFGGINIANLISNRKQADEILSSYVVKIDEFQSGMFNPDDTQTFMSGNAFRYRDENYYIISKKSNGTYAVKNAFKSSLEEGDAKSFYDYAYNKKGSRGYIDNYRYLKQNEKLYLLDCSHFFDSQKDFLFFTFTFSFGGILIFFLCSYFGSALIFKNVKANDSKQKEFITDASHQLKTPLMVISANNDLIAIKNGESEETRVISKQIEQMGSMISTLLTISKSSEANRNNQSLISLSGILNESIEMFKPLIERENLRLNSEIAENIKIFSDDNSINEIIKIVLENAVKYAKSTITVKLRKENRYVELIETNDSEFSEDKDLNYLSERFVRDEIVSKDKAGSGIGLALLKTLCENQKLTLDIRSKDGNFVLKIKFKCK